MSRLSSNLVEREGHVYYDLQITNIANVRVPDNLIQLTFDEQRISNIVDKADDYDLSVVRFQCDTFSLPVFSATIRQNSDLNSMVQELWLIYTVGAAQQIAGATNLIWEPADETITPPSQPSSTPGGFQVDSPYYYCYDYDHVLKIVNKALKEAMDRLKADAVANPNLYPNDFDVVLAPFMCWNESTNTATLYSRADYFDTSNPPSSIPNNPPIHLIEIYFLPTLYSLFSSFPVKKKYITDQYGNSLKPPNFPPYYQIMVDLFHGVKTNQKPTETTEEFIATPQEYSTISEWSPVSSLVFCSATLPVAATQLSNPCLYLDNQLIQLSRPTNNFANIITDLVTDEQSYCSLLLYYPTAEYRMLTLNSTQPINQVDIQVFWKNKIVKLIPFYLPSGGSCSLKLMFVQKKE